MTLNHRPTAKRLTYLFEGPGYPEPDGDLSGQSRSIDRSNGPAVQRPMTKWACNRHPLPKAS
jgi:hypothetical protein